MTMEITAAVLHANGQDLVIEPVELSEPAAGEVLVRIVATGMCHTDITIMEQFPLPWPGVLGHEGAGIIAALGEGVTGLAVGDHVVLCQPSCGQCRSCLRGQPSYCLHFAELCMAGGIRADGSCTHQQGAVRVFGQFLGQSSFASHALVSTRCIVRIDDDVPLDIAAPLSCGVQTGAGAVLNALHPKPGDSFAVFGAGAVGLSALMAAKIAGCYPLIAIDRVPERLALALELGASHIIDAGQDDPVAAIKAITGGGVDGAVEAAGLAAVMLQAVAALAQNGTAVLVSSSPGQAFPVDPIDLQMRGIKIRSSLLCADGTSSQLFIPQLITWWKAGMFPFDRLIRRYDFAEINTAKRDSLAGTAIKPVLTLPSPA